MEIGIPVVKGASGCPEPELLPGESITFIAPNVRVVINEVVGAIGTWILGSQRLYWTAIDDPETINFSLSYPSIVLHAICQDLESFPKPCLYCQVDFDVSLVSDQLSSTPDALSTTSIRGSDDNTSNSSKDSEQKGAVGEIRFVPDDVNNLKEMFQKLSNMASIHPSSDLTHSPKSDRIIPYFDPDAPDEDQWFTAANLKFDLPSEPNNGGIEEFQSDGCCNELEEDDGEDVVDDVDDNDDNNNCDDEGYLHNDTTAICSNN